MPQVKDGTQVLTFQGDLLAKSSSWKAGNYRWVEFELYRTAKGAYVLGRIGVSLLFHDPKCTVVQRNNLKPIPAEELADSAVECEECDPALDLAEVCPEKFRYWAQVSDTPQAVIDALYKYDASGARYLTTVARNLVIDAAEHDPAIGDAFYNVTIE